MQALQLSTAQLHQAFKNIPEPRHPPERGRSHQPVAVGLGQRHQRACGAQDQARQLQRLKTYQVLGST